MFFEQWMNFAFWSILDKDITDEDVPVGIAIKNALNKCESTKKHRKRAGVTASYVLSSRSLLRMRFLLFQRTNKSSMCSVLCWPCETFCFLPRRWQSGAKRFYNWVSVCLCLSLSGLFSHWPTASGGIKFNLLVQNLCVCVLTCSEPR